MGQVCQKRNHEVGIKWQTIWVNARKLISVLKLYDGKCVVNIAYVLHNGDKYI